jgi:hypothetical protein
LFLPESFFYSSFSISILLAFSLGIAIDLVVVADHHLLEVLA